MDKTANMSPNLGSSERVYEDNDVSFWFLQLSGWFALALISFLASQSGITEMSLPLVIFSPSCSVSDWCCSFISYETAFKLCMASSFLD